MDRDVAWVGHVTGMGRGAAVLGGTALALLTGWLMPSWWWSLAGPVGFVTVVEVFETARDGQTWPLPWPGGRHRSEHIRRLRADRSRSDRVVGGAARFRSVRARRVLAARRVYLLWVLVAVVLSLARPTHAAVVCVPVFATLPWALSYALTSRRFGALDDGWPDRREL